MATQDEWRQVATNYGPGVGSFRPWSYDLQPDEISPPIDLSSDAGSWSRIKLRMCYDLIVVGINDPPRHRVDALKAKSLDSVRYRTDYASGSPYISAITQLLSGHTMPQMVTAR